MSSRKDNVISADEQLEQIDISAVVDDMWKGFKRFWLLLLIFILAGAAAFYVKARFFFNPQYTASSTYTVMVGDSSGATYDNQMATNDLCTTLEYILNSKVLRTMVADDLGVDSIPGKVSISVMDESNLLTISVVSSDAQSAYDVLQTYIADYPQVAQTVIGATQLDLMDETGVPTTPSNLPDYRLQIEIGALVGLGVSVLFLLIYALTRHTIQREDDFKKYLNVECFGVVPKVRFKRRSKKEESSDLVLMDNYRVPSGFREAMRSVRSRLERKISRSPQTEACRRAEEEGVKNSGKVLLVTSAIPGEGKSTVAANIALALAMKGRSVILADMDLRNPSVAKTMNLTDTPAGVIDILAGKSSPEDAMVQYKRTSLGVITGGKPIGNTSRALSSERAHVFVNKLRGYADYIVLDTPPCAVLSDATIVAKYADHAIFVVRQDYARADRVLEGMQNLAETGINVCGCMLNNAEIGVTGNGYSRGYGYGRYGYGYGNKKYGYGYGSYGYSNEGQMKDREQDQ